MKLKLIYPRWNKLPGQTTFIPRHVSDDPRHQAFGLETIGNYLLGRLSDDPEHPPLGVGKGSVLNTLDGVPEGRG